MTGPAPLRDGALLFLGSQVLVFRIVTAAELEAIEEDAAAPFGPLPTCSPTLALTCAKLRRLARTQPEILLVGETGVGKEVFASASTRPAARRPFVAINCAAIPRELVESELFGYERGAHSTAQGAQGRPRRDGRRRNAVSRRDRRHAVGAAVEAAALPAGPPVHAARIDRVVEADVRIVAATSRMSLGKGPQPQVQEAVLGRLGAQPILLPPLRDRVEDVGRLVTHFLRGMTTAACSNRRRSMRSACTPGRSTCASCRR